MKWIDLTKNGHQVEFILASVFKEDLIDSFVIIFYFWYSYPAKDHKSVNPLKPGSLFYDTIWASLSSPLLETWACPLESAQLTRYQVWLIALFLFTFCKVKGKYETKISIIFKISGEIESWYFHRVGNWFSNLWKLI